MAEAGGGNDRSEQRPPEGPPPFAPWTPDPDAGPGPAGPPPGTGLPDLPDLPDVPDHTVVDQPGQAPPPTGPPAAP
ncbi:MAG TPA: hypothetical protein VHJ17_01785, partial [Thermomonospora sp.]|nr:hypothetical protein [Thermomonospora sp.]